MHHGYNYLEHMWMWQRPKVDMENNLLNMDSLGPGIFQRIFPFVERWVHIKLR